MKKTLLTLTFGLMASTSVFAADIANPFYQPAKGSFYSDTNVLYQNAANGGTENAYLAETLSYGLTRKLAVTGTIADNYNLKGRMKKKDNWANPAWSLGIKYNLIDCTQTKLKVQVGADYTQGARSLNATYATAALFDHHSKSFSGYAKVGYDADGFVPYLAATIIKPIGKFEEKPTYIGRAAAYVGVTDAVSLDAGLDYMWSSSTDGFGAHAKILAVDGAVYYKLSDAMSLGAKASYVIDVNPEFADRDYYTIGLNLKATF